MSGSLHWLTEPTITGALLESETLSVEVVASQGATISSIIYKPAGIDLLWKSHRRGAAGESYQPDSFTNWCDRWLGGWSTIFPNGGDPCHYRGMEMGFHGEAGLLAWNAGQGTRSGWISARFETECRRSPFTIEKIVSLSLTEPCLEVRETIQNTGSEPFATVWGHHPTFGAPFIDEGCRILIPAEHVTGDDHAGPCTRVQAGTYTWPHARARSGEALDVSLLPSRAARSEDLLFIGGLRRGEYRIYNPTLKLQVTVEWPLKLFPHLWFWQEFGGTSDYPWFGRTYCIGLEPFSAPNAKGLAHALQQGTALTFQPGEIKEATFRMTLKEGLSGDM